MRLALGGLMGAAACGRLGFGAETAGDGGLPPCTSAICECNLDTDCLTHEYCSAHDGEHTCECVAGYAKPPGGACSWVGVVGDPGFQQTTVWMSTGTAIDPALDEAGMVEPGAVRLVSGARVTQSIVMPRLSRAESLVLEISSLAQVDIDGFPWAPSVGIGRIELHAAASMTSWSVDRQCLGASAFAPETSSGAGAPISLVVTQSTAHNSQVDHLDIVPALPGECLAPGPVANGDAEGDGNWTFLTTGGPGAYGGFAAGVGASGSRGVRLYLDQTCESAGASLTYALPGLDALPSPALSFYLRATAGAQPAISSGVFSLQLGTSVGTGAGQTVLACLPATSRGEPGGFIAREAATATCGTAIDQEAVLDDVAVVDDPSCGTDPSVADPGFESMHPPLGTELISTFAATVQVTTDPAQAHSGNAALRIGATETCARAQWTAIVLSPPGASAHPALEFYYRATPANNFVLTVGTATIVQDGTWHRGVVCYGALYAGLPQGIVFLLAGGGTCGTTVPEEVAYIDDLAVVDDPSCP